MSLIMKNVKKCIQLKHSKSFYNHVNHTAKKRMNFSSNLLQPMNIIPKDALVKPELSSKSQKLMLDLGFIRQAPHPGTFSLLPLAQRSLQKLITLVDKELNILGAQKISLPSLTCGELWKSSGRWKSSGPELFKLQDRHNQDIVLSPTHEEAVTELVASFGLLSYKQYPLMLYQITNKFRDEAKSRSGLLRAREFLMKDLYTFDTSMEYAKVSYRTVRDAYHKIFSTLGVDYITVEGDATSMGGTASEEFHFLSEVGEDLLVQCINCGMSTNSEMITNTQECPSCGKDSLKISKGIEVGHCFILGTQYSKALHANFLNNKGKPELLHMGCHGLGLTRIIAAAAECLSTSEELRWPLALAPYTICIIPPKEGSKEVAASEHVKCLYTSFEEISGLENDILVDDRTGLTIGRRFRDANRTGYPFIVIAGKSAVGANPVFEVHETSTGQRYDFNFDALMQFVKQKVAR